jgi:hypothetical protein
MNRGFFFIAVGIAVLLLWTTILPVIDRAIVERTDSNRLRRSPAWRRFQRANTKQAIIFGCFLVLLGILNLMSR